MEILATTVDRLHSLIAGRDPEMLERRPSSREWSPAEIVGHLLDDEIVFAFRLRMTLTADQPSYAGNDPDRWALLPKPAIEQLLSALATLRAYNLWTLRAIPRSDWSRIGLHAEQGPETVEVNIRKTAAHDLAHIDQLTRCFR